MEYDVIQDKIDIVQAMIRRYEEAIRMIQNSNGSYSHVVKKLEYEKYRLQELKDEYPEYFI